MDPRLLLPLSLLAWYLYFLLFGEQKKPRENIFTRITEKRELPESGVLSTFYFMFCSFFISSSTNGNAQTRCNLFLFVFLLCSSDNHLSPKHLFYYTILSLPVWVLVNMWNWIVMTVSDFYFYFKILYWIMYILNNVIILPVCNIICVETCLYIIMLYRCHSLFSPSLSWLGVPTWDICQSVRLSALGVLFVCFYTLYRS